MKWEYRTITDENYLYADDLNDLSKKGWELVSHDITISQRGTVVPREEKIHYYVFKREIK